MGDSNLQLTENIDWTHAKQNLRKAFELLPKKKAEQVNFENFKNLLYAGDISKIVSEVKRLFNVDHPNPLSSLSYYSNG